VKFWLTLVLVGIGVAGWVAPGIAAPASRGGRVTADEPQYLLTALSLGEDFNLDISDERAENRYRNFHEAELPVQEQLGADGRAVSPHDPLLPAILALPMRAGGWIGAKLVLAALAGALAALMVWIAVRRFALSTRVAVITVLAFSATAPLAMYGTQVYPELPAALVVAIAIAALTGDIKPKLVVLTVASIVALPWLSVKYAPVAAALAVVAALRWWRAGNRDAVLFGGGVLALAGALFLGVHQAWYGGWTAYASGDHFVNNGEFSVVGLNPNFGGRATRLIGLLIDRDFGLAAWSPVFLLAIPAFATFVRRRPDAWDVLVIPLAVGWFNATFVALTMHGWWWPGRQTVIVLPCVALAVAWWAAPSRAAVWAVGVLGAIGASIYAWLIAQAVVGDLTTVVTFETITHPLVRAWRVLLPDYRDAGVGDWVLHGIWLVAVAATVIAIVRPRLLVRRKESTRVQLKELT
jgi:hypothetical protein